MEFAWSPNGVFDVRDYNLGLKKGEMKSYTTAMCIPRTETTIHPYAHLNQFSVPSFLSPPLTANHLNLKPSSFYYRRAYPDLMQSAVLNRNDAALCANQWGSFLFSQLTETYYIPIEVTDISLGQQFSKEQAILTAPKATMVENCSHYHKHSTAYMKRNVYKSIIRAMERYRKNNEEIIDELLKKKGYSKEEIRQAYNIINELNREDSVWKNPKKSRAALHSIVTERTASTYILKETLSSMLNNWRRGSVGRMSKDNLRTYREVYQDFYNQTLKLLSGL
jgi:hypothetical protein